MRKKKPGKTSTILDAAYANLRPTHTVVIAPPAPAPRPQLTNHVIFMLDDSGSMRGCYYEAVRQLNVNIENVKAEAARHGQRTTVSLYLFSDGVRCKMLRRPLGDLLPLACHFRGGSQTNLIDAVKLAIADGQAAHDAYDPHTSFLLVCATDGGENGSRGTIDQLREAIRIAQATDRWTLAFMGPPRSKAEMARYGIPGDNVVEWSNTTEGTKQVFAQTAVATSQYYATRSAGGTSTSKFYETTDLSNLTKREVQRELTDLSANFKRLQVEKEVKLQPFIEGRGMQFFVGAGYYLLMKREQLRPGRHVLVVDKASQKIYGGPQARALIGLSDATSATDKHFVTPGNHANYDVYIQSTSRNRVLIRGTKLLWDATHRHDSGETWDQAGAEAAAAAKKASQPAPY